MELNVSNDVRLLELNVSDDVIAKQTNSDKNGGRRITTSHFARLYMSHGLLRRVREVNSITSADHDLTFFTFSRQTT